MKNKTLNKDKDKLLTMGSFYGWPMGLWFMIFFVAPLIIIFIYSFLKKEFTVVLNGSFRLKRTNRCASLNTA